MVLNDKRGLALLAIAMGVSACTSGGPGPTDGSPAEAPPAPLVVQPPAASPPPPTPVPSPTPAPTPSPTPIPLGGYYDREANIANCDTGQLKAGETTRALDTLNAIRALHGLKAVTYDNSSDIFTAKSALIGVANQQLTHTPTTSMYCYSTDGAFGSEKSNLFLRWASTRSDYATEDGLASLLIDDGVITLGHRRWFLHPFLSQISFGRVDGKPFANNNWATAMSVRVIGYPDADLTGTTQDFVAYPIGNYPAKYFKHGWYSSFSVLADKRGTFFNSAPTVDYTPATILVQDLSVQPPSTMPVTAIRVANDGFGLPNSLQWITPGTQYGKTYSVKISRVRVPRSLSNSYCIDRGGGLPLDCSFKDFEYTFTIQ